MAFLVYPDTIPDIGILLPKELRGSFTPMRPIRYQTMSELSYKQPRKLHLITQRDQPYGSVRKCCEMCGAYGTIQSDKEDATDDVGFYDHSDNRCINK